MTKTLLTPQIEELAKQSFEYISPDPISHSMVRYYCLAIGENNKIYSDEKHAIDSGYKTTPVPPTFVTETNSFMQGPPGKDGAIAHEWGINLPGTRYIRGGNKYEFFEPFYVGDIIKAQYTIEKIAEKQSSKNKSLLILTNLINYFNQDNVLKCNNYETVIYQEI
jgi:hypothetical protein